MKQQENHTTVPDWDQLGREYGGQIICGWCDKHIRFDPRFKFGEVSHGMCSRCADGLLQQAALGGAS